MSNFTGIIGLGRVQPESLVGGLSIVAHYRAIKAGLDVPSLASAFYNRFAQEAVNYGGLVVHRTTVNRPNNISVLGAANTVPSVQTTGETPAVVAPDGFRTRIARGIFQPNLEYAIEEWFGITSARRINMTTIYRGRDAVRDASGWSQLVSVWLSKVAKEMETERALRFNTRVATYLNTTVKADTDRTHAVAIAIDSIEDRIQSITQAVKMVSAVARDMNVLSNKYVDNQFELGTSIGKMYRDEAGTLQNIVRNVTPSDLILVVSAKFQDEVKAAYANTYHPNYLRDLFGVAEVITFLDQDFGQDGFEIKDGDILCALVEKDKFVQHMAFTYSGTDVWAYAAEEDFFLHYDEIEGIKSTSMAAVISATVASA